jgi:hypothetical protein
MSNIITNRYENIYLKKMNYCEITNNIYSEDYSSDSDYSAISTISTDSSDSTISSDSPNSPITPITPKSSDNTNEYYFKNKNLTSEYTCELDKNNPLISSLINKRIDSCVVGPSSHIAAFLQNTVDLRSCFIPSRKRKGRNR